MLCVYFVVLGLKGDPGLDGMRGDMGMSGEAGDDAMKGEKGDPGKKPRVREVRRHCFKRRGITSHESQCTTIVLLFIKGIPCKEDVCIHVARPIPSVFS